MRPAGCDRAVQGVVRDRLLHDDARPGVLKVELPGMTLVCDHDAGVRGGLPPASSSGSKSSEPVAACTSIGQSCLVAPGKLGLCVERTGPCEGSGCDVCQSQH
jgi:hypothetical protein